MVRFSHFTVFDFEWQDGNMIRVDNNQNSSSYVYTYSNISNKTSFILRPLLYSYSFIGENIPLYSYGLYGEKSRKLPISQTQYLNNETVVFNYDYILDDETNIHKLMKRILILTAVLVFACSSDDSSDTNDNPNNYKLVETYQYSYVNNDPNSDNFGNLYEMTASYSYDGNKLLNITISNNNDSGIVNYTYKDNNQI